MAENKLDKTFIEEFTKRNWARPELNALAARLKVGSGERGMGNGGVESGEFGSEPLPLAGGTAVLESGTPWWLYDD